MNGSLKARASLWIPAFFCIMNTRAPRLYLSMIHRIWLREGAETTAFLLCFNNC